MAGPPWDDDVASERADANLAQLAIDIPSQSNQSHVQPTSGLARDWHREMVKGIEVPDDAYRGGFRGDSHAALTDYEVTVGRLPTVRACDVSEEISRLISELQDRVSRLDKLEAEGDPLVLTTEFTEEVLNVAAWLHCEWVRIHPL